jgi:hypothetical protein
LSFPGTRPRRANATGLVAEGVDIETAQALPGHSNAQLTLGLYAQAVVSLGAAAADSMAERFGLPARDGRAMERGEEGSEGQDDDETQALTRVGAEGLEPPTSAL